MRIAQQMKRANTRIFLAGQYLDRPKFVPRSAKFIEHGRNEICIWGEFLYEGKAQVAWSNVGKVLSERYFDAHGRAHGLEVSRHENGAVEWQVPWVRGQMYGFARQFDDTGHELLRTRFIRGAGVDLWVDDRHVVELREMRDSVPHGVEKWGHPLLPYEEGHFLFGKRTGVFRRWSGSALVEGFPKYFVDDEEVSRFEYLRLRRRRPELPPDRRQDDRRERPMHPELLRAWIRKDIRATLMQPPNPEDRVGCGAS